jgi:hypothetical protein
LTRLPLDRTAKAQNWATVGLRLGPVQSGTAVWLTTIQTD